MRQNLQDHLEKGGDFMACEADIAFYLKAISVELKALNKNLAKIEAELHDMKLVLAEKLDSKKEEYRRA